MKTFDQSVNILASAVLISATGCFSGDTIVHRTISLSFPVAQQQTIVSLSVSDTQVQEALKLVDDVLVARGYARNPNLPSELDRGTGFIASYGVCGVTLKDNRLHVGFAQAYRRNFSPGLNKTITQLEEKLRGRYGAERVRVE